MLDLIQIVTDKCLFNNALQHNSRSVTLGLPYVLFSIDLGMSYRDNM